VSLPASAEKLLGTRLNRSGNVLNAVDKDGGVTPPVEGEEGDDESEHAKTTRPSATTGTNAIRFFISLSVSGSG
jgi:hypothetical protein